MPDAPPPGYRYAGDLFGDLEFGSPWRFLLVANLLALLPLGAGVALLWLPYQVYVALGAPLARLPAPDWPSWGYGLFGLAVVVASMLAHEALHGAALLARGHPPRFGFAAGYLYATIRRGDFLTRGDYLLMVLAPLALMSALGGLALPFLPPPLGQSLALALLLNAAASIGDLSVAQRALRWPPDALFGEGGGIRVFVKTGETDGAA